MDRRGQVHPSALPHRGMIITIRKSLDAYFSSWLSMRESTRVAKSLRFVLGLACLVVLFSLVQLIGPARIIGPLQAADDVLTADKMSYLKLARQGWSYRLRTTMLGRDLSIPIYIDGKRLAGAYLCIVGEQPHPITVQTINAFRRLIERVFGRPLLTRYAGSSAEGCGTGRVIMLRLYSGAPPNRLLSADLAWMNEVYALGLRAKRAHVATSPAMAQTFFGRRGQGTHIMVQQPRRRRIGTLEERFFRSILIEELYQSFTFGMDVLLFDRNLPFVSKLQEKPTNLHRLPWNSKAFMQALLKASPAGLCAFDVFMLHAVARSPGEQTNEPGFIDFIEAEYDTLISVAGETLKVPFLTRLLDPACAGRSLGRER
ncbi:MAG: hypothetical protein AAFO01_10685 [Pseudomonadota bacterium]